MYLTMSIKNAVHGAPMAQVRPFIQQSSMDLTRRFVHEAFTIQQRPDDCPLLGREVLRGPGT